MYEINFNRQGSPVGSDSDVVENSRQETSESVIAKIPQPHSSHGRFNSGFWWVFRALPSGNKVVTLLLPKESLDGDREMLAKRHASAAKTLPNKCRVDGDQGFTELSHQMSIEQFVSNLLRYGVLLASTLVFVGGILYLIRHGAEPADYQSFQGEPSMFCSPRGVITALLSGYYRGIIQLGLLLLIATPIVRVAFSLFAFVQHRDFTYIIVNLLVLAGLIYSLLGAYL